MTIPRCSRGVVRWDCDLCDSDPTARMHWRLGVLDHDLTNGDDHTIQKVAVTIANWYVEDVSTLLEELQSRGSDG